MSSNIITGYGKIRMDLTVIISIFVAILSLLAIIWLLFFFERKYVTKKALVIKAGDCKTDNNVTSGNISVSLMYNNKKYKLKIDVADDCYNYTKNSSVNVSFDPNDIESTIIIASNNVKSILIIFSIIIFIVSVSSFIYNYNLKDNKVAQTVAGVTGITDSFKNLI